MTSPAIRLRKALAAARERGEDFDTAWANAMKDRVLPSNIEGRRQWRIALGCHRDEWQAAYERRPALRAAHMHCLQDSPREVGMIAGRVEA